MRGIESPGGRGDSRRSPIPCSREALSRSTDRRKTWTAFVPGYNTRKPRISRRGSVSVGARRLPSTGRKSRPSDPELSGICIQLPDDRQVFLRDKEQIRLGPRGGLWRGPRHRGAAKTLPMGLVRRTVRGMSLCNFSQNRRSLAVSFGVTLLGERFQAMFFDDGKEFERHATGALRSRLPFLHGRLAGV